MLLILSKDILIVYNRRNESIHKKCVCFFFAKTQKPTKIICTLGRNQILTYVKKWDIISINIFSDILFLCVKQSFLRLFKESMLNYVYLTNDTLQVPAGGKESLIC